MKTKTRLIWLVGVASLLIGCQPDAVVEVGFQPLIIPVRIAINSHGEVSAGFSGEYPTPIGIFDISGGVSVSTIRSEYSSDVLIVRVDDVATVYELEEGKQFDIIFNDENTLYKKVAFHKESGGDIILELESVSVSNNTQQDSSELNSSNYTCDDLNGVKLNLGDNAKVIWPKVNLRSSPVVPQVWDANIVAQVEEGVNVTIIGGPECAHEGTWWEVRTENGNTGWMREFVSDGYLLK